MMVGESAFRPYYKPIVPHTASGIEAIQSAVTPTADVCEKLYSSPEPVISASKEARTRRRRTTFTPEQTAALEREYVTDRYMDSSKRSLLAESLSLNEMQVKTWFQNRRAKDKKESKKDDKLSSPNPSKSDGSLSVSPPMTQDIPLAPIPEAVAPLCPSTTVQKPYVTNPSPALKAALETPTPSCPPPPLDDSPNENVNHTQIEVQQSPDEHYVATCNAIPPPVAPIPTSYADYLALGLNPAMSIPATSVPYGSLYDIYGIQHDYSGFLNQQTSTNPIFVALSSLDPQTISHQPLANL